MAIPADIADLANELIDNPRSVREYKAFRRKCGEPLYEEWSFECFGRQAKFNHDLARNYPKDAEMDIRFLKPKAVELQIAYFLHHLLDLCEERSRKRKATVAECRAYARQRMKEIFGPERQDGDLLRCYGMRAQYRRAEEFFISPKSQAWLKRGLRL